MTKVGRNTPCPCGSGKKYKQCCLGKESELRNTKLSTGAFRYEAGSYGSPDLGYIPSIICYKKQDSGDWARHFTLVKTDAVHKEETPVIKMAEMHLTAAREAIAAGGREQDFAISLRREGYQVTKGSCNILNPV